VTCSSSGGYPESPCGEMSCGDLFSSGGHGAPESRRPEAAATAFDVARIRNPQQADLAVREWTLQ
jgi:hypothetical protein